MGAQQEQAGCLISAVGSLSLAQLRLAGATQATSIHGELEIVSLSGTLSPDGAHLHIAVAGSRRSTCRNTSQATPALMPPVQSLRSSSTIDTVLAPMRRPRSRKRPSFSSVSRFAVIGSGCVSSARRWSAQPTGVAAAVRLGS
jgi:hypothetical protein